MTIESNVVEVRAPNEQSEGSLSRVIRWIRAVGEPVAEHEPLVEIETDKVTLEIAAPSAGMLNEIIKHEREDIVPGDLLGKIHVGESSANGATEVVATPVAAVDSAEAIRSPGFVPSNTSLPHGAPRVTRRTSSVSPAVSRLLVERGVEAAAIHGTGESGRITVDDVLHYTQTHRGESSGNRVPHSPARRRIAEQVTKSLLHTAPHVTAVFEADFSAVLAHRARYRDEFARQNVRLTLTAYVLAACVRAVQAVPETNARWTQDAVEIFDRINIGVATAVGNGGLVVPVIRDVQSLDLFGIARDLGSLVSAAGAGRLTASDMQGGTFTVSNHGATGSILAAPIVIHQPQSAALGVGKLQKRAVVLEADGEDRIVVRPCCFLTLTIDHRVMDGDHANRFLGTLVQTLESFR
jgi:2-oxoglutarate dehydrogenase E2 component (dihydrolipoamide succinyltransferase)